jgi:VWFA-related protein
MPTSQWTIAGLLVLAASSVAAQDRPRFEASVEATSIDVTVVDDRGQPMLGLNPEDFVVRVDGAPQSVVSAQWVPLTTPDDAKAPPVPQGYSSNEGGGGGRLIVLVIDQPNIRFGGAVGIRNAVNGFIDRLQPADRVSVVGIGAGARSLRFTSDKELVKQTVAAMQGSRQVVPSRQDLNIAISEAVAIRDGDRFVLDQVVERECGSPAMVGARPLQNRIITCRDSVQNEAQAMATEGFQAGEQTVAALRVLLGGLWAIDAPKTIVLVTEGFIVGDQDASFAELGDLAAAARVSIYALKLEDQSFDVSRRQAPTARFEDRVVQGEGIERLTNVARGALFHVTTGADPIFERIEAELAGYYQLGFESAGLTGGQPPRPVSVTVERRGAVVRSRRRVGGTVRSPVYRTASEAVMAGLVSPLVVSGLPIRVGTFALQGQGPEASRVQILIHAEVGGSYATAQNVSIAYVFTDRDGRIVESQTSNSRLRPVMNGVPSPLQFTAGASLAPGEYTLKFVAAEGELVGSVEHPVRATLLGEGPIRTSELLIGGPVSPTPEARPAVGNAVSFGNLQGYVEVYGSGAKAARVIYEVATTPDGPAVLSAGVPARTAGDERAIFNGVIAVRQLPPGTYVLRAVISADGAAKIPLTLSRTFEVTPPTVLMTEVGNAAPAAVDARDLFLPVGDELLTRSFSREHPLRAETLRTFRSRVAPAALAAFDNGVALLGAGDYGKAELTFKGAIRPDSDSSAALAYLAATFAASGHDTEAASAWQTALIDGGEIPEIYQWLGDALMRTHDLGPARDILEEAVSKWPTDERFIKPLALVYATFGQGSEAVRTLQRHLQAQPGDVEGLAMAVEWLYTLRSLGVSAHSPAEDLKLARSYAAAYEKASGPQVALVKQWLGFLEGQQRQR